MAPVIKALRSKGIEAPILATGQHRELLNVMLKIFDLRPDWNLDLMQPDQSLAGLTGFLIPGISNILKESRPSAVLAQGDTTTVFCTALAAYYEDIPFGHVEAGLRSGNKRSPFPEEGNRRMAGVLAKWHFAPTETAKAALLNEGFPETNIHIFGNTVIDALLDMASRPELPWPNELPILSHNERLILVTLHRRESFGEPLSRAFHSIKQFALAHPDAQIVYPVHPNPNVLYPARTVFENLPNLKLIAPLEYPSFVNVLKRSYFVVTDSGGLQEEAPALGKPVLVLREVTERPEAIAIGGALLIGTDPHRIQAEMERLWNNPEAYQTMAQPRFPFGDGNASMQIASILEHVLA